MKKLFAVLMVLVLTMAMVCTASAEVKTFGFVAMTDLEGNVYDVDTTEFASYTLVIDDEAMTMAAVDPENTTNYTLEVTEATEQGAAFTATSEDGSDVCALVVSMSEEGNYLATLVSEELGIMMVFSDAVAGAEEAVAEEAAESVEG